MPVILGIPWLAGIFGGVFSALTAWLLKFLTRRVALVGAAVISVTALYAGFITVCFAAADAIIYVLPDQYGVAMSWIVPANLPYCVSAVVTVKLARYTYYWSTRIIQWELGV